MAAIATSQLSQYVKCVNRGDVQRALLIAATSPGLGGIIAYVNNNTTDGGIAPKLELAYEEIEIDDWGESSQIQKLWLPVVIKMVNDLLTLGYTCVIVNPAAKDKKKRVFVPDPIAYDVRWIMKDFEREYVAFPAEADDMHAGGHSVGLDPIKNSFVLVRFPPLENGYLTSPVAKSYQYASYIDRTFANLMSAEDSQTNPMLFTQAAAVAQQGAVGTNISFMTTSLDPSSGISLRRTTAPSGSSIAQDIEQAKKLADEFRYGPDGGRRVDPSTGTITNEYTYGDRTVADVAPGRVVVRDPGGPQLDIAGNLAKIRELDLFIGRAFGVSASQLRGDDAPSSVVAGVDMARRALAVMIVSLQDPIATFLEDIFALYYSDLLRDVIMQRTLAAATSGEQAAPTKKGRKRVREPSSEPDEEEPTTKRPRGKRNSKVQVLDETLGNRIIILFNSLTFLDFEKLLQMYLSGMLREEAVTDLAGRMYRLPQSVLSTSEDPGPHELLLEPLLEDLKMKKAQRSMVLEQRRQLKNPTVPQAASAATTTPAAAATEEASSASAEPKKGKSTGAPAASAGSTTRSKGASKTAHK